MNIFGAGMYIKQLADKIDEIIVNEVSFGNKLLYAMCVNKEGQEWVNVSRLADKLWLVGRAYTASPERRFTNKEKNPNDYHGDGTGMFFEKVANNIIQTKSYEHIVSSVQRLKKLEFNAMLKIALQQFDESCGAHHDKKEYKNHISFCSKFLHFHAPHNIFILDYFTEKGAKTLVESCRRQPWVLKDIPLNTEVCKLFSEMFEKLLNYKPIDELVSAIQDDKEKEWAKRYYLHSMREYAIGCFIREHIKFNPEVNMPRLADSVCQQVRKADKNGGVEK